MNFHARSTRAHGEAPTFGTVLKPFSDAGIDARDLLPLIPPRARMSSDSNVPPANIGKVPGRYSAGSDDWRGLTGRHFSDGLSDDVARAARDWPTANVGVRGAAFHAIDSDVRSHDARRLVDRVIVEFQGWDRAGFAVRTRGNSPRTLYAFAPEAEPIRSRPRAIEFTLPDDKAGAEPHMVEVIGAGKHWVAAGEHPGGDRYGWQSDADFAALVGAGDLLRLTEADVDRILDAVADAVERDSGTVLSRGATKAAGGGSGELRDFSRDEPAMPVDAILRGLDRFPNTRANVPDHDGERGFVAVLSAIRAALGCEADAREDKVRRWATAHEDDTGADDAYFDRVWGSLDAGVRAGPDSLDRWFRRAGVFVSAGADFPDDAHELNAEIRRRIGDAKAEQVRLLREIAQKLIFSPVDTSAGEAFPQVRARGKIDGQEKGRDWWAGKSLLSDEPVLKELHEIFGGDDIGFWRFFRALNAAHPTCIFRALVKNPLVDIGEMVECMDKQGNSYYELNTLALPAVQKMGAALPKGSCSPKNNADVALILKFMEATFCEFVDFELDTIAFMAQKKKRVGNGLILHGDPGVGKSAYCEILSGLFNSPGEANYIPGNILKADDRAFAMTALEGARILELREIPSKWTASAKAGFESLYKQVIDSSVAGDTVKIEAKGKDARAVPNYARLVATTNNMDAFEISAQDRRLFYVSSGIRTENMPTKAWWADLHAVLNEPKRIACFWRYLLDRDVERFNHHQTPPVTRAKLAQQVTTIENPASRHMRVVVMALSAAGRRLVDSAEIKTLMHAAAVNEAKNTKRRVDDRDAYTNDGLRMGTVKEAFLFLQTRYPVLREMRTGKARLGTMYAVSGDLADTLADANNRELTAALDDDRERHRLSEDHWPTGYEGPVRPDANGADDFAD